MCSEVQNLPRAPPRGGGNFLKSCITRGNFGKLSHWGNFGKLLHWGSFGENC
jgi:hypothetical protein